MLAAGGVERTRFRRSCGAGRAWRKDAQGKPVHRSKEQHDTPRPTPCPGGPTTHLGAFRVPVNPVRGGGHPPSHHTAAGSPPPPDFARRHQPPDRKVGRRCFWGRLGPARAAAAATTHARATPNLRRSVGSRPAEAAARTTSLHTTRSMNHGRTAQQVPRESMSSTDQYVLFFI